MNSFYFNFLLICLMILLIVGILICTILFIIHRIKKQSIRTIIISIAAEAVLLLSVIIYYMSHSTYYKYNDWSILQSNIHMVEQKYGEFDLGEVRDNEKGRVAYYIYIDNGPVMPDYLKHYYYMEYDEWGIIYNVYEACQPGG